MYKKNLFSINIFFLIMSWTGHNFINACDPFASLEGSVFPTSNPGGIKSFSDTDTILSSINTCENNNNNVTRVLYNAISNIPLEVSVPSLAGSKYSISGINGLLTDGDLDIVSLSDGNVVSKTLTNAIGNQIGSTLGILYIFGGNYSGTYADVKLTNAVLEDITATGDTGLNENFIGTYIATGSITTGNFDIVFVELPVGTVFTITDGDLASGTFTTTETGYAVLETGLSGTTQIFNGAIHLIQAVTGTYNYTGTNYPNGQLYLPLEGLYALGTLVDANHFQATGSPTGITPSGFTINVSLAAPLGLTGALTVQGGEYNTRMFTAVSGISLPLSVIGTLNAAGTGFAGSIITLNGNECIGGYVSGETGHITTDIIPPNVINNFEILGSAAASLNGLVFTGTEFIAGEFVVNTPSQDFVTGTFCS